MNIYTLHFLKLAAHALGKDGICMQGELSYGWCGSCTSIAVPLF